ncbi:MAG: dethiobiotin synthase [Muribaculaceae bacterium]|nr:dethiobiotin synthase [Muribaculaceae bacterium]
MTSHRVLFISGIDTDAGKTYATAWLAQQIAAEGRSVITQKFIQTGCTDSSEDIEAHRRLCGMELQPVDLDHTTAPIIFSYPASAQLAARIDGREIDLGLVEAATGRLLGLYDCVLLEGAGGLMVPVTDNVSTIDYVAAHRLPVVLVTNGRLGSINHTVLSLEAIAHRGIELAAVVYNHHFDTDPVIAADTRAYIARYLSRHFPATPLLDLPTM